MPDYISIDASKVNFLGIPVFVSIYPTKIKFHGPATIVFWNDGTKTVVKCRDDELFDPEKAVALCYMKRATGNTSKYNKTLKAANKLYEDYFYNNLANEGIDI